MIRKSRIFGALALLSLLPLAAGADVINTLASPDTSCTMPATDTFSAGPIADCNYTWTSTHRSVYGYTRGYGLVSNGTWSGIPHAGLDTGFGSMTFTFNSLVNSVLAFVNYAPGHGTPTIAIYDDSNNLLESMVLNINTSGLNQGEDWGFARATAEIRSFVLSNAYIVATRIRTGGGQVDPDPDPDPDPQPVPEPASIALFGMGLIGIGLMRRRRLR